jgi:hypothetical protein
MNECVGGLTSRSPLRIEQPRREVMVEPEAVTTLLRLRALGWGPPPRPAGRVSCGSG